MWYYESNNQTVGPFDNETITNLLAAGTIDGLTRVSQEGTSNWKHLGETVLSDLIIVSSQIPPVKIVANTPPAISGEELMWYYESNNQTQGPVSNETIANLLAAGTIDGLTRVWQEGMVDWKHLGETVLSDLIIIMSQVPPIRIAANTYPATYPPALVVNNSYRPRKVEKKTLGILFGWCIGLMGYSSVFNVIYFLLPRSPLLIGLPFISYFQIMAAVVLQYVLLYKYWEVIQDDFVQTTPGKAIGFLFIPWFHFYWMFVAYFGLAKNMNQYVSRHFDAVLYDKVRKTHSGISLSYLIFWLTGGFFLVVYFFIFMILNFTALSNFEAVPILMKPFIIAFLIYYILQLVLSVLMNLDFYLTSKGILEAEELKSIQ